MTTVRRPAPINKRHLEPARVVGEPEPGFFRVQLVSRGPYYGARIEYAPSTDPETGEPMDRTWWWTATIDGELVADPAPCPVAAGVFKVWEWGSSIGEEEYNGLIERSKRERSVRFKPFEEV